MKIAHIVLCGIVTDGFLYQDNLLPKYHKKMGHKVSLITSRWIINRNGDITMTDKSEYFNADGVYMIRLKCRNTDNFNTKFKFFEGITESLNREKPDILFVHGVQFLDMIKVVRFVKSNREIRVYVDNHADFVNSGRNLLSKYILHGMVWRLMASIINPYTTIFYGVLPVRVNFMIDIYKVAPRKCRLLIMGADDDEVKRTSNQELIEMKKRQLNIEESDFIIVTGGKIDLFKKQILLLMQAVKNLNISSVKLIVFGSVIDELKNKFMQLLTSDNIIYVGWADAEKTYEYFAIANLVIFPGTHSVYWEQAVGQGKPIVCKYWPGITHIDIGGNVKYITKDSIEEIQKIIRSLLENHDEYEDMVRGAQNERKDIFMYSSIAERSIEPHDVQADLKFCRLSD